MTKTIDEKITHLEHNQAIIIKSLETIKAHLWSDEDGKFYQPKPHETEQDQIKFEEREAENYVNNIILPKAQGVGVQGFWQGAILNYLKQQALNFIGTTLKRLALEKLTDLSKFLLDNLEDYLLEQYKKATPEGQAIFKKKMFEQFPNSKLTKQL